MVRLLKLIIWMLALSTRPHSFICGLESDKPLLASKELIVNHSALLKTAYCGSRILGDLFFLTIGIVYTGGGSVKHGSDSWKSFLFMINGYYPVSCHI